ncbi:enolase C-terminal domain-like protein [Glycomyces sp. MUSA5-2]|uniref:enolase C-terminal domain-like protein n=1 Tax=Glycomyces sp. MUSA5-2 TaxID=2053002 RepID=UPI003008FAE2
MSEPLINRVTVALTGMRTQPGDDTVFVGVHAADQTGWYGPVSGIIGRAIEAARDLVIGASPFAHERLRPHLRSHLPTISDWAVGAIDCAIWDLHGKLVGRTVANLLAPHRSSRAVRAYFSWLSQDLSDTCSTRALSQVSEYAWAFTKWGLRRRPERTVEVEAAKLVTAMHRAGSVLDGSFAVDAVGTWDRALAEAVAATTELPPLIWLEDPLPEHLASSYRRLTAAGLPIAIGERLRPEDDFKSLLQQSRVVALTIDVVGCGGITRAVQILETSRNTGVPMYPHGRSMVPGIHLAAAYPDAVPAVEYRHQWEPRRQLQYTDPWNPMDGRLRMSDDPGLGANPRSIR